MPLFNREKKLINELKTGNTEAFKKMVERYQDNVINTCYGFLKNKEDSEDVAQEVFIEVYRSIARFRQESKLSTWLYRIAVTKSLDFIRRKQRKKRFAKIQHVFGIDNEAEQVPAHINSNPDVNLENQERSAILQAAIDSIAENQKIAITLSKIEGLSNKEVAEIMGTSVSAVESLVHRAKNSLYKKLYQYYKKTG